MADDLVDNGCRTIGKTPLVRLKNVTKDLEATIAVKLEYLNASCSVKDRISLSMIRDAEKQGKITPGKSILIEPTSGNSGIALAYCGRLNGYKVVLIMQASMSIERRTLLKAYGAEVVLVDPTTGFHGMEQRARELVEAIPNAYMLDQFSNPANPDAHFQTTGPEIWCQTHGEVKIVCFGVGSGGTLTGVGRFLKSKNPEIKVYPVEPYESSVINGFPAGHHKIPGIGTGRVPANLDRSLFTEAIRVKSSDAMDMARRLAREEAIFAGPSTGANVCAAIMLAKRPENRGKLIVTTVNSFGERYLSTDVYAGIREEATKMRQTSLAEAIEVAEMSLLEPGPGILSTYVTVDEIQKAVQRVFGDSAKFGEAASFTNIGVGNGFMSRIVLVDPNWKAKPLFAPAKFILKLPSLMTMLDCSKLTANPDVSPELMQSMMASFEAQLRRLHNTEITVYDWMRTYKPKVPSCEVYFSKAFDGVADLKGVFVMQYIDNTVRSIVYDNVTLAQIEAPLRALASFEAMGRKVPEAEREKITSEPFRRIFADLIAEPAITAMINMMETSFPGRMTDLLAKLREYLLEILDIDFVESIPERLGMERVLTHGDLWANNMLFQRKEDGSADLAAVIDFQTSHWGCAVTDLARLFNACLSGDDRRQHWERLVETFYGFLQEELVGQKMPYTLEQLKTAYREYFPFGGIMVAPMVPGMVPILVSDPESPEYKKLMEKAYSKSEAMIADIITQHEENKKNRVQ